MITYLHGSSYKNVEERKIMIQCYPTPRVNEEERDPLALFFKHVNFLYVKYATYVSGIQFFISQLFKCFGLQKYWHKNILYTFICSCSHTQNLQGVSKNQEHPFMVGDLKIFRHPILEYGWNVSWLKLSVSLWKERKKIESFFKFQA